jgi:hypothetical protein
LLLTAQRALALFELLAVDLPSGEALFEDVEGLTAGAPRERSEKRVTAQTARTTITTQNSVIHSIPSTPQPQLPPHIMTMHLLASRPREPGIATTSIRRNRPPP